MPTSPRTVILCVVAVAAVLCIPVAAKLIWAIPTDALLRDTNAVLGAPPYVGAISTLGLLLWGAAAAISVLTALVVPAARAFWLMAAAIALLLLLDDWLMIHESVESVFGIPDASVFGLHGALMLAYLYGFRNVLLRSEWIYLLAALGGFGGSIAVDLVDGVISFRGFYLLEDGLKFGGIAFWLVYQTRLAARFIAEPAHWAPLAEPSFVAQRYRWIHATRAPSG